MQQDHPALACRKKHPSDAVGQPRSEFPESRFQFPNQWHSQRPAELHGLDSLSNYAPFLRRQSLEPIPYWFRASIGAKEHHRQDWFIGVPTSLKMASLSLDIFTPAGSLIP